MIYKLSHISNSAIIKSIPWWIRRTIHWGEEASPDLTSRHVLCNTSKRMLADWGHYMTFAASKIGVFWEVVSKYLCVLISATVFCKNPTCLRKDSCLAKPLGSPFPKKANSEGRRTINPSSHAAPCCQLFPQAGCSNPLEQSLYLIDQVNGTPSKREHSKLGMIEKVANLGKDGLGIINILHWPGLTKALGFPSYLFSRKVGSGWYCIQTNHGWVHRTSPKILTFNAQVHGKFMEITVLNGGMGQKPKIDLKHYTNTTESRTLSEEAL